MPAAPAVIWYMHNMFKAYSTREMYPQLTIFVKDGIWAQEERKRQILDERTKMARKTLQVPLRYSCATPGCSIEANSGTNASTVYVSIFASFDPEILNIRQVLENVTATKNRAIAARSARRRTGRTTSLFAFPVQHAL